MADKAALYALIKQNEPLMRLLEGLTGLDVPGLCLGAGSIAQTVWNHAHGLAPMHGISDFDVVYFDAMDLGEGAEREVERRVLAIAPSGLTLDVKNEARVHLWYEARFGYPIAPYASLEAAIDTWPTTATAIIVWLSGRDFQIYAPFGLEDLFSLTIRANKAQITRGIYEAKCAKWRAKWPKLHIVPW